MNAGLLPPPPNGLEQWTERTEPHRTANEVDSDSIPPRSRTEDLGLGAVIEPTAST